MPRSVTTRGSIGPSRCVGCSAGGRVDTSGTGGPKLVVGGGGEAATAGGDDDDETSAGGVSAPGTSNGFVTDVEAGAVAGDSGIVGVGGSYEDNCDI